LAKTGKKRSDYYIATKINPDHLVSEEQIRQSCSQSLQNLGTDYIDLYQIHWPNHNLDLQNPLKTLKALQDEGKIRAIGVSNFGVLDSTDLFAAASAVGCRVIANQLPYSLLTRAIEYGIIDKCLEYHLSILAYSPLAQGLLSGKYKTLEDCLKNAGLSRSRLFLPNRSSKSRHNDPGCEKELIEFLKKMDAVCGEMKASMAHLALYWLLKQKGISTIIVGASRPDQLESNVKALQVNEEQVLNTLNQISEPVKLALGSNPDLWDSGAKSRYR